MLQGLFRPLHFLPQTLLLTFDTVKIISMPYNCKIHSRKDGSRFSSTAMIRRWKASSQRQVQIVAYGVYNSTPRALVGLSTPWRYDAHLFEA